MSVTEKVIGNPPLKQRGILIKPFALKLGAVAILIPVIAIAAYFMSRGSDVERGTAALVEALSKQRLIEPRLSGGFKCGEFRHGGGDVSGIDETKLSRAQELIEDEAAKGGAQAQLGYGRLLLARDTRHQEALRSLRLALAGSPDSAEAHNDVGVCLSLQEELEEALEEFEVALKHRTDMPEALFNRALCYQRLLLRDQARDEFTRLANIERDKGWLKEINQRLEEVSGAPATQKSNNEVSTAFDAALADRRIDEARRLADQNSESISRHAVWNISIRHLQAAVDGDHVKAERALSDIDLIGRVFVETRGDSLIADIANYLRSVPGLERPTELELIRDYVRTSRDFQSGNDTEATFKRLEKQFRECGNYIFETLSAFRVADQYYAAKRFRDSMEKLKGILSLIEKREWPHDRAKILSVLALETSRLGQDSLAIKYFEQALSLCRKSPELESRTLQYMSVPYLRLGDFDAALSRLRDSTKLFLENGLPSGLFANLAYNYLQMADIYSLRSQHALALLYAEEALGYSLEAEAIDYAAEFSSFIAAEHAQLNQFDEAKAALNRAFEHLDKIEAGRPHDYTEARVLSNAGKVASLNGDLESALRYYERAEALAARDEESTLQTIDVLRQVGQACAASGQSARAHSELMRAVTLIENYRANIKTSDQRSHFLDASHNVFDQLISIDVALARSSEAFEMSERSRARALLEEIWRGHRAENNRGPAVSSPLYANESRPTGSTKPLRLADVQSQLPDDLMVLEYSVTSTGTYLFLVTRSSFKVAESSATTGKLDRLVGDYLSDLRRVAPIEEVNEKARELYDYLIKPIEDEIGGNANLCLVPDKGLHSLPFAGLVDASNKYLIESHRLTYAPSASVLVQCIKQDRLKSAHEPERILAVGNPRFDREYFANLQPLADAESEASQSTSFYAPGSVTLTGERATEPSVRAAIRDCDVAHLALHCLVEESSPWLAALVLAPTTPVGSALKPGQKSAAGTIAGANTRSTALANTLPQEPTVDPGDGVLYLRELYGIKLHRTRLVVLSACQSGLGQYYRGEGIVSLVRPLLAAGVPTVVASLWPVDSRATSDLMIDFHSQRKLAHMRAGDALRATQIKLARNGSFQHPYYWAPFIVVGANN